MRCWSQPRLPASSWALYEMETNMTLHEAIVKVLREARRPLSAAEIAATIDAGKLFLRGDRRPIPPNQIHARVSNHPELFTRTESGIRLA